MGVSLQGSPGTVDRAIGGAMTEIARLRDGGVTAEEMEEAKTSAIGSRAQPPNRALQAASIPRLLRIPYSR